MDHATSEIASGSKLGINQQETVQRGQYSSSSNAVLTVLADTDGNSLPDEWESAHGLADADGDADGDGASNRAEYLAGTDPNNPQSYLRIGGVSRDGTNFMQVNFVAISNRTYAVQAREHFDNGSPFRNVADVPASPTNRVVEITRPAGDFKQQQFFRLVTPRIP